MSNMSSRLSLKMHLFISSVFRDLDFAKAPYSSYSLRIFFFTHDTPTSDVRTSPTSKPLAAQSSWQQKNLLLDLVVEQKHLENLAFSTEDDSPGMTMLGTSPVYHVRRSSFTRHHKQTDTKDTTRDNDTRDNYLTL
ncbi:hypothetical protein GWK47_033389 [Chionoecetes opilio]|uniref:Uncharacterized protein n=1 Tax=Chionoecetes opilio TaxID=41210 RepID=A0A8J4YX34_CHIOP|nr:hypothetical protein GWK47_033389 [Chionoecetes opilio]